MSRTITISLYSTVKSAPLMTSSNCWRYPLVKNFMECSTRLGVSRNPSRAGSSPISVSKRRTVSCIPSFYLLVLLAILPASLAAQQAPAEPGAFAQADELYRHREDSASAKQAAALYERQSAKSYEAAWKLSRAAYWLATAGPEKEQKSWRDKGVKAGEQAISLDAKKPEG